MIKAALYEYEIPLRSGITRRGCYLKTDHTIVEIAPLPEFSIESFEDAKQQLLSLFLAPAKTPLFPSVSYALSCLKMRQYPLEGIQRCGLLRSVGELMKKPGFSRYKLKMKNLSLKDAISFTSTIYNKTKVPLRIDCNQGWSLEKTLSFLSCFSHEIIEYIEEPTNSYAHNIRIGQTTAHTVALDESLLSTPFSTLAANASEVVFILKPMLLGQLDPYLQLRGKKYVLSSTFETGVGMRWLLNCARNYSTIDQYVGCDTYEDLQHDPSYPHCTGEILWNVQLENGLKPIRIGSLFL